MPACPIALDLIDMSIPYSHRARFDTDTEHFYTKNDQADRTAMLLDSQWVIYYSDCSFASVCRMVRVAEQHCTMRWNMESTE
jgi:hypothetical protein